jgi:hypothetical protein
MIYSAQARARRLNLTIDLPLKFAEGIGEVGLRVPSWSLRFPPVTWPTFLRRCCVRRSALDCEKRGAPLERSVMTSFGKVCVK